MLASLAPGGVRGMVLAIVVIAAAMPIALAEEEVVRLIVHKSRAVSLSAVDVRAMFLKQRRFWPDGRPIVPINLEAGSETRETFSRRLFGQTSRRLASYWNQRYFEAGEFPPATLASEEAVLRFVAENADAIGYVSFAPETTSVAVVLVLD